MSGVYSRGDAVGAQFSVVRPRSLKTAKRVARLDKN